MNIKERYHLLAERTALERMLESLPKSSVIDRMSLEARKAKVEKVLADTPAPCRNLLRTLEFKDEAFRFAAAGRPIFYSPEL